MRWTRRDVVVGLAAAGLASPAWAADGPVLVFAAASLKNALDAAIAGWSRRTGLAARASYAASNTLAKQVEAGAPADLFVSADRDWMDYLAGRNLIRPETRIDLLGNRLVLVAPKRSDVAVTLGPGLDLRPALGDGRLAMGMLAAVPAGKYGQAALQHLGAWEGVKDRVAQAESVRAALLLVSRGEAPLGIVYATDAVAEPGVRVVATFPPESHPPIVYPLAQVAASRHPDAASLLAFLSGPEARDAFTQQGFTVLASPAGRS
ncbi:molybdate ABC transporter substrate-binding protein [Methylobacterium sp. JK268]